MVLLLTGLGLTLWWQGGLAFSPGALSAVNRNSTRLAGYTSHADFERQCNLCHQPLVSMQFELCLSCHLDVNNQIRTDAELHGVLAGVDRCADCHSDHRGREFDPRLGSLEDFDHSLLGFSLIWHQVDYELIPMDCIACHSDEDDFPISIQSCAECHAIHDSDFIIAHIQEFGDSCLDCHDGEDSMVRFDHDQADFILTGSHLGAGCGDCHIDGQFTNLPGDCIDCHVEPAVHMGAFAEDCAACHNSESWSPAFLQGIQFNHGDQTGFSLDKHGEDFAGSPIACVDCHGSKIEGFTTETCTLCHFQEDQEFIDLHQDQFGGNCLECHDGIDRMRGFAHADFFPLDGRHGEIGCRGCHEGDMYQDTPEECAACHLEPQIHAGYFGLTCEYCHLTSGWYPAQLINHNFPIDHGDQGQLECSVCHTETYADYSCYGCHEHRMAEVTDEHLRIGITSNELPKCVDCHADGRVAELNHEED